MVLPQCGIAILGMCVCVWDPMPPDFPRSARPPAQLPVWKPHKGCVRMPHKGLLLLRNSTMVSIHSTKDRPEPLKNTISAANGVATPPFRPRPCKVKATGLNMPPAALEPQKDERSAKNGQNTRFGPGPPVGPRAPRRSTWC